MPTNEAVLGIKDPAQAGRAAESLRPAFDGDTDIEDESRFDATLHAVILYDTVDCAAQASALLKRAAQKADETIPWNVKPWRVDILQLPPASEAALAEAEEAHLIVIALGSEHSVLPWLVEWLEQWAARRRVREAALAVWSGGSAETLTELATPTLIPFARRHGLRLLLGEEQEQTVRPLTV